MHLVLRGVLRTCIRAPRWCVGNHPGWCYSLLSAFVSGPMTWETLFRLLVHPHLRFSGGSQFDACPGMCRYNRLLANSLNRSWCAPIILLVWVSILLLHDDLNSEARTWKMRDLPQKSIDPGLPKDVAARWQSCFEGILIKFRFRQIE